MSQYDHFPFTNKDQCVGVVRPLGGVGCFYVGAATQAGCTSGLRIILLALRLRGTNFVRVEMKFPGSKSSVLMVKLLDKQRPAYLDLDGTGHGLPI